eukprot:scaffold25116_cov69-Phaeocystis_antarctica.AAC.3
MRRATQRLREVRQLLPLRYPAGRPGTTSQRSCQRSCRLREDGERVGCTARRQTSLRLQSAA